MRCSVPTGDIMNTNRKVQRSWFWWVYAGYLVLAFAASIYASLLTSVTSVGTFAFALDLVAVLGFYGFLRQRPIFSIVFWQLFALLYIAKYVVTTALMAYVATHLLPNSGLTKNAMLLNVIGAVLALGVVYALYIYAFRSNAMWTSKNTKQLS
jgi:hypothetical protein